MSADEWTEGRRFEWYAANEEPDVPATHVVTGTLEFRIPIVIPPWHTGKADAIAAEVVAAWQQQIAEDTAVERKWIDQDHPAFDCLGAAERCSSPGAMFRIEEAS